jgi:hypothetical protein
MDEKELRRLLRAQGKAAGEPGKRCPGETEIAAYVEQRLPAKDEARIESHLADCDACLEQVMLLVRPPAAEPASVAPQLLSRARDLAAEQKAAWHAPVLRWGAVAATLVLVAVVLNRQVRAPGVLPVPPAPAPNLPAPSATLPAPPAATQPAPQVAAQPAPAPQPLAPPPQSAVRNSIAKPLQLELQFPSENATLSIGQLEFRWTVVPAATYYEVQLVTDDGAVVWIGKVEGTRARPPDAVRLEAGRKYFVWIKAYLAGGGTLKSATVSFFIVGV